MTLAELGAEFLKHGANPSGTGIDDLTFVPPDNTSVLLTGGCKAHFYVENGAIRMC